MDNMTKIIHFEKTITTYRFYTKVLNDFLRIHSESHESHDEEMIFDFRDTRYINPAVVPILLAFGDYVRRLYKSPAKVIYERGSELHNFFVSSRFYAVSQELKIFEWDHPLNGTSSNLQDETHMVSFNHEAYADADRIEDLKQRRDFISGCLRTKTSVEYRGALEQARKFGDEACEAIITALAEIGTNSIMYSKTRSFSYVAIDRYKIMICMADSGIGFERSFQENNRELELLNKFSYTDKFRNFLVIMSVLKYSCDKHETEKREDLWTLRTKVIMNKGVFKIQYENTQVILSHNRCRMCNKCYEKEGVTECVKCLMKDYSPEVYSPIKIYGIRFQGVRVEISFDKSE